MISISPGCWGFGLAATVNLLSGPAGMFMTSTAANQGSLPCRYCLTACCARSSNLGSKMRSPWQQMALARDSLRSHISRHFLVPCGFTFTMSPSLFSTGGPPSSAVASSVELTVWQKPLRFCVQWNKGGCSKENCPFKHEVPKKREKSATKSPRGRSQSRGKEKRDTSKIACKFWKAGRCKRGDKCEFSHEGQQRP